MGPGTVILKVNFLCINGTRKPLLIHGFPPVNAQLLTVYATAFYAIILFHCFSEKRGLDILCKSSAEQGIHMKHQALFP